MVFNFDNSKKNILEKVDKSNKGSWDSKIISLCELLNSSQDYFTTSSCSGRVVLIREDDKKGPGLFVFRSHDKVSLEELKLELGKASKEKGVIYFKQEPCFVVVSCKDKERQWDLFEYARNNGWKKSGILSVDKKLLVEIMSTESLSFPIMSEGKILVEEEFLEIVVKRANYNLQRGWDKIEKFKEIL